MVVSMSWMTALFLAAWPYSHSFLKAPKALFKVLVANVASPFSNLEALRNALLSLRSGRVWIFLKAITTKPALLMRSLLRKFLWISVTLLFNLNFWITYLTWSCFELCNNWSRILIICSFWLLLSLSLIFSILLTSLHLLKQSLMFPDKFLNNWIKAFSLRLFSLESMKALSVTDLIA